MLQFKSAERLIQVSNTTVMGKFSLYYGHLNLSCIGASGEYSDFQEITRQLKELDREVNNFDDKNVYTPKDLANYLGKFLPSFVF